MVLKYYFLTLDYCNTSTVAPTIEMYHNIIKYQFDKFASNLTPNKLQCFEYKRKSKKFPEWLHYHCILQTYLYVSFSEAQCENWSIKYIRINDMKAMANFAGYICKDKIDIIDVNKYNCW